MNLDRNPGIIQAHVHTRHPMEERLMDRRTWLALALLSPLTPTARANGTQHDGPWRTVTEGSDERLMLEGHDAVAYFEQDAAVRGDPAIRLEWAGVQWRFSSERNRAAFQADPWRFAPQLGGWCSNGMSYAIPWGGGGGPDTWRIYRGRLHVFGGQTSRDHFELDTETNLGRSHAYWRNEVMGSNALVQRYKRLVFRVPHYRSGSSLTDEWEARRAAGTLPVMPGGKQAVPR
jgi:hypothetical protein